MGVLVKLESVIPMWTQNNLERGGWQGRPGVAIYVLLAGGREEERAAL